MKSRHIILRSKSHHITDNPYSGAFNKQQTEPVIFGVETDEIDSKNLPQLTRDSTVLAVAPVMPMKLITPIKQDFDTVPKLGIETWGVRVIGADKSPYTGNGIVVAVLDTGIDSSHSAFSDIQITEKDFTGEGNGDSFGHGTHCAGTIFGRDVQGMRIGVATGVKKALIGKVLNNNGDGSSDQIMDAIIWAIDNGATIITMSLGLDFHGFVKTLVQNDYPTDLATTKALEAYRANTRLFEKLASLMNANNIFTQSSIIVAAAGNESKRTTNPDWKISVSPPAASDGIISVAALDEDAGGFVIAPFSNTGANISAPGVAIVSAKTGGGLQALSGTSMATPHVAGVAALWADKLKRIGRLNGAELSARLISNATLSSMKLGYDPFDVGAGMVWAPQE